MVDVCEEEGGGAWRRWNLLVPPFSLPRQRVRWVQSRSGPGPTGHGGL